MSGFAIAAAVVAAAAGVYAADSSRKATNKATDAAKENAKKQLALQQEALGKENMKTPDMAGYLSANQRAAKGGQSGTLLTGPSGVDASQLTLGKNTLLGG